MKSLLIWTTVLLCAVTAQVVPSTESADVTITTTLPQSEDETTTTLEPELVTQTMEMTTDAVPVTTTEQQPALEARKKRAIKVADIAGQPNQGMPNHGLPNAGTPNHGLPNLGMPNHGLPNTGMPNHGLPNAGIPNAGMPNPGMPNPGMPNPGIPQDVGLLEKQRVVVRHMRAIQVTETGMPNKGIPNLGLPNAGMPNQGVPNKGIPNVGAPSEVVAVVVPAPEVPLALTEEDCDLLCTKFELNPICATNGICMHEFPTQCIMDTFNCKHRDLSFKAVREELCQSGAQKIRRCTEQDLKM